MTPRSGWLAAATLPLVLTAACGTSSHPEAHPSPSPSPTTAPSQTPGASPGGSGPDTSPTAKGGETDAIGPVADGGSAGFSSCSIGTGPLVSPLAVKVARPVTFLSARLDDVRGDLRVTRTWTATAPRGAATLGGVVDGPPLTGAARRTTGWDDRTALTGADASPGRHYVFVGFTTAGASARYSGIDVHYQDATGARHTTTFTVNQTVSTHC